MAAEPQVSRFELLEQENTLLRIDLENAERALRMERRKVNELRKQMREMIESSPSKAVCEEIVESWKARCGHPRAMVTPDRIALVERALKWGYTKARLETAILGASVDAFEKDGKRYDDLELILRDAKNIERFEKAGERAVRQQAGPAGTFETPEDPWQALHDILVEINDGPGAVDIQTGDEMFDCPRCEAQGDLAFGVKSVRCRGCGARHTDIIHVLRGATA